jgi:hypothetical protein
MRPFSRIILLFSALFFICSAGSALAQCPEDPTDSGLCDTLYVEVWRNDTLFLGEPRTVRVPLRVTHDLPDPYVDSIAGFVIPLCYTNTNPTKYCSLNSYWNNKATSVPSLMDRSIFRHLPDMFHWEEHNRLLDLFSIYVNGWDFFALDLGDGVSHFWATFVPTGIEDQRWWEGSRVLLATMTFRIEDTTTVCMDTCYWPPGGFLAFSNSAAESYTPRTNLPYCFSVTYPGRGDSNGDGRIDIQDAIFLLNYLFKQGPAPVYSHMGDANSDDVTDLSDAIYLLNYLFKGGPPPSQ